MPLLGSLLQKIAERTREEARQPGSWGVFAFFCVVNLGQAIFADSVLSCLIYLAIAGFALFIALRFFRASRAHPQARAAQPDT